MNGNDIRCECSVSRYTDAAFNIGYNEYVIYARNEKCKALKIKLRQDVIAVSQKFVKGKFGEPLKDIVAGFMVIRTLPTKEITRWEYTILRMAVSLKFLRG